MFTASQLARVLNRSKRGLLYTLQNTPPSGKVVVAGNPTNGWRLEDLTGPIRAQLEAERDRRRLTTVQALFTPAPWTPPVPFKRLLPADLDKAAKLREVLRPFLEANHDANLRPPELEARGIESFQRTFGYGITPRHWRRLIKRTQERDGGARAWHRVELYLGEGVRSRPKRTVVPETFDTLQGFMASFAHPVAPTLQERQLLWVLAFEWLEEAVAKGHKANRAKRSLITFLDRQAPFLGKTSALRHNFARKHRSWVAAGRPPAGLPDLRPVASGHFRAPALEGEDRLKLLAKAVEHGGRESQAWRELRDDLSINSHYLRNPTSKSYVPRKVREAITAEVNMMADVHHGPRQAKLNGAYVERDATTFAAGEWFQADDCTLPNYYYEESEKGFEVMRGQFLAMIDCRTTYILGFVLISERNYNSRHIRNLISTVADDYGLPQQGFYFENGTWRSRLIVGRTNDVDWTETEMGLRGLGLRFRHARLPRGKVIERVFGTFQSYLEAERGYVGRDERHDKFERIQKQLALIRQGKEHPAQYLHSKTEWVERLTKLCDQYNAEAQDGKYLKGLSPKEGFEKFFGSPLVKLPPTCRYLLAQHKLRVRVNRNGISFQFGRERYTYKNEETGRRIGRELVAWFNPEDPSLLCVTDTDHEHPFTVERALLVPAMDAPEEALAQNERHDSARKALYRTVKPYFAAEFRQRMFRSNRVDAATAQLGTAMNEQQVALTEQRREQKQRTAKARKVASQLGIRAETIRRPEQLEAAERLAQLLAEPEDP
jgi:hypothetical protein